MARDDLPLVLDWVPPGGVRAEDWEWLREADKAGPPIEALDEVRTTALLHDGKLHLFRLKYGQGVVMTEVRVGPDGLKRLALVRVAGRNLGWLFPKLAMLLQHTARDWGCQQIETMVYEPRLVEALRRVGAKAEAINMVLEVGQ